MNRRDILRAGLATGATVVGPKLAGAARKPTADDLNIAVIGVGRHGRCLVGSCLKSGARIPNLRFKAICDIWDYHREHSRRWLNARGHVVTTYEDYREMLAEEKDLDAVIIATPDFVHAEQTNACLEAGLAVYCEQPMAHTIAAARSMVQTAEKTGKLLQIGHQRRSNPRYIHAADKIVKPGTMLGRITTANAQWHGRPSHSVQRGWPGIHRISARVLARYRYRTMREFCNWPWYTRYSAGRFVQIGTQQIDVVNWFLDCAPNAVIACGGRDHYEHHEWYDNVMAIYEYTTRHGTSRVSHLMPGTGSLGGRFERFMGPGGTLTMSQNPYWSSILRMLREGEDWNRYVREGIVGELPILNICYTCHPRQIPYRLLVELALPPHQPHLVNFFDAVRGRAKLNCPADMAFKSELPVFKTNEAIETGRKIALTVDDYRV